MARKYNTDDDYLRLPIRTKTAKRLFKGYVILCIICGIIPIIAWMAIIVPIFTKDRTHAVERKFGNLDEAFKNFDDDFMVETRKSIEESKLQSNSPSESSER